MSAPEFKALFNSNIFRFWFDKTLSKSSNKNVGYNSFIHTTRKDSKLFINNSMVDFVLPLERLESMLDPDTAKGIMRQLRSDLKNLSQSMEGIEYNRSPSGQEQIIIKDLKFSTLNTHVANILDTIATRAGYSGVKEQINSSIKSQQLDKGHVFGFGNTLLFRTKEELRNVVTNASGSSGITEAQLKALDDWVDALIDVLEDYDIQTSNIKDLNTEIYVKYRKTDSNWLIEWQTSTDNQKSGSTIGRLMGRTGAKTYTGARGVFTGSATETVVKNFIQQFIDESVTAPDSSKLALLNQKSSPSLKDLVTDTIVSAITGRNKKLASEYIGSFTLPKITVQKVTNNASASITKAKSQLKSIKAKVQVEKAKAKRVRLTGDGLSLSSLQILLNRHLQDVISANMGDGSSRSVLNYRTGRFAASARVERLIQSKKGMITAFYTYMRNPYGTFSDGGKQQYPKTRDPKLLISQSIKEIAATMVGNRMRAVLA